MLEVLKWLFGVETAPREYTDRPTVYLELVKAKDDLYKALVRLDEAAGSSQMAGAIVQKALSDTGIFLPHKAANPLLDDRFLKPKRKRSESHA